MKKSRDTKRARALARIFERPSPEAERSFREMMDWLREGMPPAWDGRFLSSRCGPIV